MEILAWERGGERVSLEIRCGVDAVCAGLCLLCCFGMEEWTYLGLVWMDFPMALKVDCLEAEGGAVK